MTTGVYLIRNLIDGKEYVGSAARSVRERWNGHRNSLRRGRHRNRLLQKAWNACGEAAFEFSILEECLPGQCLEREQWFLDALNPVYNICRVAGLGGRLGLRNNPEARAKMSTAMKGNQNALGHRHTAESRARMRHLKSPETRAKLSAALKGNKNSLGHIFSPESRARISAALKGHAVSPGSRAKMSLSHKYKKLSVKPSTQ